MKRRTAFGTTITMTAIAVLAAACGDGPTRLQPRAPVATGSIPAQTVHVGESVTVRLTPHFSDPDGDQLTYAAASSDDGVADVDLDGSAATITGVAVGSANVTITATDPGGLSAQQVVGVTVPSRAPAATGSVPAQTVHVGESGSLNLGEYFSDPDGEELTYSASSSDDNVADFALDGSTATITGLAVGTADVTVTATDPGGLSAQQVVGVTVPSRAPAATGSVPAQTVHVGESGSVNLGEYFSDPDDEELTYAAASSNSSVATVAVSGSTATITGAAVGTANITFTATDPGGLSAQQVVGVTVPSRAPVATGSIPAQTVPVGESGSLNLGEYFSDPDGDVLTYSATSSNSSVAVAVSGSTATITGVAVGTANITVTATDPSGLSAQQVVGVTVPNRAPVTTGSVPAQTVQVGESVTVRLTSLFSDPDGDALTYLANSSNSSVTTAAVSGSTATITGVAAGTASITVTATDPGGLSARQVIQVTVRGGGSNNRPPVTTTRIPAQTLNTGQSVSFTIDQNFSDPDGDVLTYSATSSNSSVATAAVSGSTARITGVAAGTANVTVTATDPGGLAARQVVQVTVRGDGSDDNRPPVLTTRIPSQTLDIGQSVSFDLVQNFSDPDGDALTYSARALPSGITTVAVSGSTVTITGVAAGSANVFIAATDPGGLSARQTIEVTVGSDSNRPPVLTTRIPSQTLDIGQSVSLDLVQHFSDPDGDTLTYHAFSSNRSVATAAASGSTATITGVAAGRANVTISASDPDGLAALQVVQVTVAGGGINRPPVATERFPSLTFRVGQTYAYFLGFHFSDPDGDKLTYSAASSDTTVVRTYIERGHTVNLSGVGIGTADVTFTATDPGGLSAQQVARMTIVGSSEPPASCPGFSSDEAGVSKNLSDREILTLLYNATGGANWRRNENWLSDKPLGSWQGVVAQYGKPDRVMSIDMIRNEMAGSIPPEIGQLTELEWLQFGENSLTGSVPPELGNLSNLEYLGLAANNLTGSIPPELGRLSELRALELHNNSLSGTIPPKLCNLGSLRYLQLRNNNLTGSLPPELGNLGSLRYFWVSGNQFTGSIPNYGRLGSLEWFLVHDNRLTGELSTSLLGLANLVYAKWGGNDGLCAPRNAGFDAWLKDQLQEWDGPRCSSSSSDYRSIRGSPSASWAKHPIVRSRFRLPTPVVQKVK